MNDSTNPQKPMVNKENQGSQDTDKFDPEKLVKEMCSALVESDRESYKSDIESFDQYKVRKVEGATEQMMEYFESINSGYTLLLTKLETMDIDALERDFLNAMENEKQQQEDEQLNQKQLDNEQQP